MTIVLPDWNALTDKLYEHTVAELRKIYAAHPDEVFHALGFAEVDEDPIMVIYPTIETEANARQALRTHHEEEIERVRRMLKIYDDTERWRVASHYVKSMPPYTSMVMHKYPLEMIDLDIDFHAYYAHPEYPQSKRFEDDYLSGSIRLMIWNTIERLEAAGEFNRFKRTSPFLVLYENDDNFCHVLRLIW